MATSELQKLVPQASDPLIDILDAARGPVEPPIRAEIFGPERFAQHGRSLGETHRAARSEGRSAAFFPRLRDNIRVLREAQRYIGLQASTGYDISPAAEWLLDNFHLIEAQLKEIHDGLPRRYFRALPLLVDEPLAGLPRVYGVAWAFVAHTDGAFDEALLVQYLQAYQHSRELDLSELWALPTTLRVVLIENLRRLAERVATNKAAREVANLVCDRIEHYSLRALDELLALLQQRGVGRTFLAQMAQRLGGQRQDGHVRYHDWLERALPDTAVQRTQQAADQAADNLSVSNAVTSLRAIGDADWSDIVATVSPLMRVMLASPIFEAEDPGTRDQTLHGVEKLARRSGHSEASVAQTLLDLVHASADEAAVSADPDAPAHGAAYWLRGAGRPALRRALGMAEPPLLGAFGGPAALARRLLLPAYLAALALGTAGLIAWLLVRHRAGLPPGTEPLGLALLGGILMAFPASEAVVAVINRLISESVRPRHLPRLALAGGIPAAHRVMVVIPALLTDARGIAELAHRLRLHYLANPERHAQFALLSDGVDADTPERDGDAALLAEALARIRALNEHYPMPEVDGEPQPPRFLLLHRERRFSETEQRWIGWERKRGKLEELVGVLAEGDGTGRGPSDGGAGPFLDLGEVSRIAAGTRYLLTLDSDTQLPPGRLRELVGVAAHPDNQPQLDRAGRRVVRGYGILQPRVATPLPASQDFTLYHWLFAGQCGIDPYSAASSEVYQDLFGEGTFTGKGLLNVQAFHAVLAGRLPEGRILSHDLLEGSIARCAAVTDVSVIEDAPFHADVAASRIHRWTRGDWQLLPVLLTPWRYPMRAINRWKMFDNLRRSLVAPASAALLVLALAGQAIAPGTALALVFAAFCAGPLLGALAGLAPSRDDVAKRHFFAQATVDLGRALWGGAWHVAQLLQEAWLALDAIVRALYRQAVSRRRLLQWTTAAAAQASARTRLPELLRQHRRTTIAALLIAAALLALGRAPAAAIAALGLLWAGSPLWTWWVSRPRPAGHDATLPARDRDYLAGIARDTWRLFERCVGPEDNHLPPDNLQTAPHDMVAHRTSPTNIGLYLLATACAHRFGWIGAEEMTARLEATLATLGKLQRHRGHFLNWYDTQSLAPLLPMYVSTVDSGNLSGHLLATAQACRALAQTLAPQDTPPAVERLHALAQAFDQLAWEPDYSFLYHRKRRLLHIGYRVAEQQLDASFYDLLASESRLTSLLAIAKGDVPVDHWAALGRPFYAVHADAGLRSWSGSMFEYLMPSLVLDEPHGSVLREAGHAAVLEQIAFTRRRAIPWGISESAYAGRDHTLAYQYAPQGVPRLALRRTPSDELVIAPYATALAAQVAPHRAAANFAALQALAARAQYGFIEALDFSPARQADDQAFTPVHTFMAHHQGMTIVALANVLFGGIVQRWGMATPAIEAVASLLHERAPREVPMRNAPPAEPSQQALQRQAPGLLRHLLPGVSAVEPTHLLSNGRYNVALRPNGAGWSRWGPLAITRWRDDALRDPHGSFFYLRWDQQPRWVSATHHPAPDPAAHYHSTFHADRACFETTWPRLQVHTTVWVSPEDDIEFRRVELRNLDGRALDLEFMSAFEAALADPRADEAHPAFMNLFVRGQWLGAHQALVLARTPRLPTERGLQAAHFLAVSDPQVLEVRLQTDRQRWLGRNRAANQPLGTTDALPDAARGDATLDTGLDPVCALAVQLRIAPHGKAQLTFATAASDDGATLRAVIDKYRQPIHVERASLMSATLTGIRLRTLGLSPDNLAAVQSLTTALALTLARPQPRGARFEDDAATVCDRRLLWRFGISGDRPIVLVTAGATQGVGLLRTLAQALRLWAWGGITCDLVVVNAEPASYLMALHREAGALRERHGADSAAEPSPGGSGSTSFHLLRADELTPEELSTLRTLARVHLPADGRPLVHHVQAWAELHEQALLARAEVSTSEVVQPAPSAEAVPASAGEFAPSGEFRFETGPARRPVRPWINVLANPGFGAQVSEAGGGYTWARNSRLNQLTAWSNDPVADPPSEWLLLQDRRSLEAWSATPSAWGAPVAYHVAHGQGYTSVSHAVGNLEVTATWCVDGQHAVKQVWLRVTNRGHRTRHLRAIGIAEWMMGANRADRGSVHTALLRQRLAARRTGGDAASGAGGGTDWRERKLTALLATQRERSAGFGGGTAFLATVQPPNEPEDWTCDRRELFDARGRLVLPDHFGERRGGGLDPCAALAVRLDVEAGATQEAVFHLGYADSEDAARQLATRITATPPAQRLQQTRAGWDRWLDATTVRTPDPLFDAMVNRWLLYQSMACRLWAKAGFYQAGGATGFRDQLQDAMALAWPAPALLREQILVCASRQFPEGDVQHWWHAPTGAGVRTHFSDDLLWLPLACARYVRATGDAGLLDQPVPFLEARPIPEGAEDLYYAPAVSDEQASVYEHAARSIDRSLRHGAHGLPLMGTGDWNDGMNRVGHEGRGESVWLGWFLCRVVADYAPLARERGDAERAKRWETAARGWQAALLDAGWDGHWFKRAFFDDGQPLGTAANAEGRIDLIAQAWSVLSGAAPAERQQQAMAAAEDLLVDRDVGLLRLLDPPLARAVPSAGYIQAYPPGVRENGGQYTHAGVWALMARAALPGDTPERHGEANGDAAYRYFTYLSPAHRAHHPVYGAAYGIEPYVVAGDVYSQPPYAGRGGWSWYTGAAAWLHRAAIESLFGLRQEAHSLCFDPCLPSAWPRAELALRRDGRQMRFVFVRAAAPAALAAAGPELAAVGAQLLRPGERLAWTELPADSSFVVPLER